MRAKRGRRTSKASRNQSETHSLLGLKTWHRGVLILTLAAMAMAWLAWLCTRDPKINFFAAGWASGVDSFSQSNGRQSAWRGRSGRGFPPGI